MSCGKMHDQPHQSTAGPDVLDARPGNRLIRLSLVNSTTVPWLPPTSVPTLHRGTRPGVRGQVLRTVLVAGVKHTTPLWIWQFIRAVTDGSAPTSPRGTPARRQRERAKAAASLAEAGI